MSVSQPMTPTLVDDVHDLTRLRIDDDDVIVEVDEIPILADVGNRLDQVRGKRLEDDRVRNPFHPSFVEFDARGAVDVDVAMEDFVLLAAEVMTPGEGSAAARPSPPMISTTSRVRGWMMTISSPLIT